MRADYLTRFKSKITEEEIELIKSMKKEGKGKPQILYVLMQRHTDPHTQEMDVDMRTLTSWYEKH